ncbi:MAG TPA: class I adenylate-forming enzyme family protein [Sphingobium sp.]
MNSETEGRRQVEAARTFPQFVRATAQAYGDDIAISLRREGSPDQDLSFRQVEARSALLAKGLIAQGVGKGTRIGFIFGNGPDFVVTLAAIARIGAIAVPISTLIKANELVRVVRQSDVSGLLVQRSLLGHDYVERVCDAIPELTGGGDPDLRIAAVPYLRWIASSGDGLPGAIRDIGQLIAAANSVSDELLRAVEAEVHPTDQMVEIYTSGSMALPKGVKHLHGPVIFRSRYIARMTGRGRGMEVPVTMPMFWVGGLGLLLLASWESGATSVCAEATTTNNLSAMGSVLRPEMLEMMESHKPYWGLGMSETFGPYSYGDVLRVPEYPLCSPLDHIADGFEVRVVGEGDRESADGDVGEIQVRGYPLAPGLHKVERESYYTADGYYRTGDLGFREGGRIIFVGRNGDMIKTNGSNVSPAEVEAEMQQLDRVEAAYVVGLPDPQRGQMVVAAVVSADEDALDFDRMQVELRGRLSGFKVPRAYVQIRRDEVPMLPSNKVARRQIEDMLGARLARPAR